MKRKIIFILLGAFFLGIFIAFTYLARAQIFKQFDFDTTVRLQNHIPRIFDTFFSVLSLIGSFEIISLVLLIILILRKKIVSFLILIPFLVAHFVETIGKAIFHHPGPPFMFFRYDINFLFPSSYVQPGYSYPSGHSLRTIFISMILVYLLKKSKFKIPTKLLLSIFLLIFDFLVLVSRVSLGEHWTTDVIGGAILGFSAGFFSYLFI